MKIPDGFTQEQIIAIINRIVGKLAGAFKFGYHSRDDMKQQGWIYAIAALEGFDAQLGGLETFLTTHIRNRFINLRRDKLERQHPPCKACPFYTHEHDTCAAFANKSDCDKWNGWKVRNSIKRNLMETNQESEDISPAYNEEYSNEYENVLDTLSRSELVAFIDSNMPANLRADYRRLLDGVKLNKLRKDKVIVVIQELLKGKLDGET